jgi:16S rRNA (guanine966-N2)-methyltransferase
LGAHQLNVIHTNTLEWLAKPNPDKPFDIVFIDPPFAAELVSQSIALLLQGSWLHTDSWIYIEADRRLPKPELPENFVEHRFKEAGQVSFGLYFVE